MFFSTYGEAALSERTCREWLEDAELKALLAGNSCQTQEELAESSGVTQEAISKRLKAMGMIQKQGNWVPYKSKPRDVERRFFACGQLLQRQNRKRFLYRIVTADEKWVHYDNPKRRKSWGMPGHASTLTARPNIHGDKVMLCIWWGQLGVVYYELMNPCETITIERRNQEKTASHAKEKIAVLPSQCTVQQVHENDGQIEFIELRIASLPTIFSRSGLQRLLTFC